MIEWGAERSQRSGYTLLEICLAMVILAVMAAVAIPLTHGVISQERLRILGNDLADFGATARKLALKEGRSYAISFNSSRVGLGPYVRERGISEEVLALSLPRSATVEVRRDGSEDWTRKHLWIFQPNGLAEPLEMKLKEGASWVIHSFNPLTVVPKETASNLL